MNVLGLILGSLSATAISLVLPLAIGAFVPIQVGGDRPDKPPNLGKSYTQEELDRFAREMREKITRKSDPEERRNIAMAFRQAFWWVTWIPWFVVPFVIRIANWKAALVLLVAPSVLALAGAILPAELLAVAAGLALGMLAKYAIRVLK
jgi:hypothetical protein